MTNKLFGISLVVIIAVSSISCSSEITGAQDIVRTQPDKVESETSSDPGDGDNFPIAKVKSGNDDTDGGGPENLSTDTSNSAQEPFRYY